MTMNGEITASEARRLFRRYWWLLPLGAVVCSAIGLLTATLLPKRYTSQTSVLIDQPMVSTEYIKVMDDLNRHLASMQEQILSRANLESIIERFGLYPSDRGRVHLEELVERSKDAISVKPLESMPGIQNQNLPGFYVTVTYEDPKIAQEVCQEITRMFMDENTREREHKAVKTTTFLSDQVNAAKRKLDEQDAKLAS